MVSLTGRTLLEMLVALPSECLTGLLNVSVLAWPNFCAAVETADDAACVALAELHGNA